MRRTPTCALVVAIVLSMLMLVGCGRSGVGDANGGSMGGTCVSFIDVGKGDCILLQSGESAALIDTGYDKTSASVLSYLAQRGVSHLDWVVLTHYDRDHVEGLQAIGKQVHVDTVLLPGYEGSDENYQTALRGAEALGVPTQQVTERLRLKLGDNDVEIFPSSVTYVAGTKNEEGNDNDMSLVATLTGNGASFLFAGDLEEEGIVAYLEGKHGQFDVLKMPHHGRKTSKTDELLEDVRPRIAIITDSDDDPADKKTLKLLDAAGADVYRTSTSGTIAISCDATGRYSISTEATR